MLLTLTVTMISWLVNQKRESRQSLKKHIIHVALNILLWFKACNKNRKYFNLMPWLWLEVWVTFLHKSCQWCIRYDGSFFFSVKSNKSWRIPIKIKVQSSFTLISPKFTLLSLALYHWIPYTGRPSLFDSIYHAPQMLNF